MYFKLALVSCVVVAACAQHYGGGYGGHSYGGGSHGSYGGGHGASSFASLNVGHGHGHDLGYNAGHNLAVHHVAPVAVHHAPVYASYGHGHHEDHHVDYHAHPKYEFKYGVSDAHTHDHHSQQEHRDGDTVHGEYSLHEADGTIRTVKYTADHKNGFNAQVIRSGHAQHPETHVKAAFVAHAHHDGHHGGHY